MLRLIITKPAERHLENIAKWTLTNWGKTQVDAYKHTLNIGLMNILEHPYIGQDASDIKNGLRKFSVDQHWVFYEINEEDIIIHAFLHNRQNPDIHLKV